MLFVEFAELKDLISFKLITLRIHPCVRSNFNCRIWRILDWSPAFLCL